jgi:hypothetical protein
LKTRKRAIRRHHNRRIFHKRVRQNLNFSNRYRDLEWVDRNARLRVHTGTQCSCPMCGNPRRHKWGSWDGCLTMAERRADDAMRDGLEEV